MMTMEQQAQDAFNSLLSTHYAQMETANDLLQKIRAKAWLQFQELGLPSRQNEVFKYVRLRALYAKEYQRAVPKAVTAEALAPHILPECQESLLVFINGFFAPAYSRTAAMPQKVIFSSIVDAMHTFSGFLNGQWSLALKEETDPFAVCNLALHQGGLFLYVPPKLQVEAPVQVLNLIDETAFPLLVQPRIQLFQGAESQLSLIATQAVLAGTQVAVNSVTDASLGENALLHYTQINWGLGEEAWQLDAFRARLKRDSSLQSVVATNGSDTVRYDYRVVLAGENAEASLNGVWMLDQKREAHAHVFMDHAAPRCRSMQLFKGALNGTSRSSFEGKIMVRQPAQKTEAYQLNNNLLLSDYAHADSKPNLEIFADDVKASHGSTVGQLDAEQIFYMKTRGYSAAAAKNLLVYGFCQEVLDMISIESLHQLMRGHAQQYLNK